MKTWVIAKICSYDLIPLAPSNSARYLSRKPRESRKRCDFTIYTTRRVCTCLASSFVGLCPERHSSSFAVSGTSNHCWKLGAAAQILTFDKEADVSLAMVEQGMVFKVV